jgi:hypothetical protein
MATVTEEIDINIKSNADETAEEFKGLRGEIRQATIALQALEKAGITSGEAFDKARADLDNLNDTLERSRFRAGQFDDRLSAMPGVLGQAGSALKQFNDSVNMFGKTLTYSLGVVGIIIAAFMAMKKSLESTAEGQATLNRISTAFQKILGPILALIESVALPVFEGLAVVLEYAGKAFNYVAQAVGISTNKIAEATSANEDFAKSQEEVNKSLQDAAISLQPARQQELLKRAQQYNTDYAAAASKGAKDLTLITQAYQNDVAAINKKFDEEEAAKAKARRDAYAAELQKSNEIIFQARIALMAKQDAELEVAKKKHEENLIQLRKTGGKGINIETERYEKERLDIEEKYYQERKKSAVNQVKAALDGAIAVNEAELAARKKRGEITMLEELKITEEIADAKIKAQKLLNGLEVKELDQRIKDGKANNLEMVALKQANDSEIILLEKQKQDKLYDITSEAYKKESELEDFINIDKLNKEIEALDREQALKEFDFQDDIKREEEKLAKQKEIYDKQVLLLKDNTAEKIKLDDAYAKNKRETEKRITDIEKTEREYRFQIAFKYAELAGQIGRLLSQAAGDNKDLALAGLAIESASALATIGISTFKNASKAGFLTPLGIAEIAAGVVAAASVALNYAKGVQEINKVPTPGGGSGGGAGAPSITPPTIAAPEVNLFTATQQGTTAGIVAGAISSNNSSDRPMKVYVTSNDVTSTQELDRKALSLARL